LLAAAAAAQPPSPAQWTVGAAPATAKAGDLVTVTVRGEIEEGWRVYAMDSKAGRPLRVQIEAPRGFRSLGEPEQMQPQEGYDRWFESDYTFFTEHVTVTQVFRLAEDVAGGNARLRSSVTFMVCNDDVCLPPRTEQFTATVRVDGVVAADASPGSAEVAPPAVDLADETPDEILADAQAPIEGPELRDGDEASFAFMVTPADAGGAGMWAFILLAIGAGLAALVSPCVFPMIPLTVSYFVNQSGDRRRAVRMASVYGLSIVTIFTGLGLALALLVGAAGPLVIASNPWVNLFIGAVLIVFGFSLLGFFEFRAPSSWLNYFNRKGDEQGGYLGVVFMGFTLTLVSFSCTVPFVGALLAQAVRAEWMYPIVGMVVFSTVFALPFVGFALFPRALQKLPKSGSWMTAVKGLFGFLVIAAAIQFLSNADLVWGLGLLPRPLAVALLIVIFALAGLFLLGRLHFGSAETRVDTTVGPFRLVVAIACFGLSLYMVPGLLGAPLGNIDSFLPPHGVGEMTLFTALSQGGQGAAFHDKWLENREEAFAQAQRRGVPVFVDFTGYTCANCRYMEANVLSRPAVAERIREHFVPVKLWTDDLRKGPELQQYQFELTGRIVLPTYAIVTPDGRLLGQISGITSEADFTAFLDQHASAVTQLVSGW
jgi:thiol:disulfide interchange protein